MADKRILKKSIKNLQVVKTWQLVIVLILLLFVTATFLRLNNTGMNARREAVMAADKAGDVNEIRARVYDLQRFSAAHMNANTGVFYLQEQYNRDSKQAVEEASNVSSASARANAEAEAICHPQFAGWSTAYMQCFLAELAKRPAADKLPEVQLPSPSLYRYSFISPAWSPDFAGWSLVACIVIMGIILLRLLGLIVLRILLKVHYRGL